MIRALARSGFRKLIRSGFLKKARRYFCVRPSEAEAVKEPGHAFILCRRGAIAEWNDSRLRGRTGSLAGLYSSDPAHDGFSSIAGLSIEAKFRLRGVCMHN